MNPPISRSATSNFTHSTSLVAPSVRTTEQQKNAVKAWHFLHAPSCKRPHLPYFIPPTTNLLSLISSTFSSLASSRSPAAPSTLSHPESLLTYVPDRLLSEMKTKTLAALLAAMPFDIAAALTAPGSAPYYGNSSSYGTAVLSQYVSQSSLMFASSLPIPGQAFHAMTPLLAGNEDRLLP